LLDAAFNVYVEHQGRWAYTETHFGRGVEGQPSEARAIFRFDPSRPYTEQFVPVKLNGQPPLEKILKLWQKRGDELAKRRQEPEVNGKSPGDRAEGFFLQIYNQMVTPLLERAVVLSEDETGTSYDVPMRKVGSPEGELFDAFQLIARVSKSRQQFEHVTIRLRAPLHIVAGKYSAGLIEIEFGSPDPKFPTVPVKITSQTTNKPLFGKANTSHDVAERTDWKHVTPYDERFGIKIGPLRAIEF
jgi:hypothetical protein